MRIQHNIPAMNALTHYTNNNSALAKNLEKLSSGYRINSAADDAAGLAISEKMRSQIAGLEKAYDNTNDGISLVQTAEGALTEVNSMLTRLKTLATQSANGTYQQEVDREAIQQETDDILSEIDRISQATNFNGINLLDGSLSAKGGSAAVKNINLDGNLTSIVEVDATKWKMTSQTTTIDSAAVSSLTVGQRIETNLTYVQNGKESSVSLGLTVAQDSEGKQYLLGDSGKTYSVTADAIASIATADFQKAMSGEVRESGLENTFSFTGTTWGTKAAIVAESKVAGANGAKLISVSEAVYNKDGSASTVAKAGQMSETTAGEDAYYTAKPPAAYNGTNQKDAVFSVNGKQYMLAVDGQDVSMADKGITIIFGDSAGDAATNAASKISQDTGLNVTYDSANSKFLFKAGTGTNSKGGLVLQVGDTNDDFQKVSVSIDDMSSKGIGIAGLDLSSQDAAGNAIDTIKEAVNIVSAQRGKLGALQNRLDHTLNNLDAMTENITSSEAQIRDTNMAKEMTAYTKNNILAQAAQSMLAQANSMPQGVLQLLQ